MSDLDRMRRPATGLWTFSGIAKLIWSPILVLCAYELAIRDFFVKDESAQNFKKKLSVAGGDAK